MTIRGVLTGGRAPHPLTGRRSSCFWTLEGFPADVAWQEGHSCWHTYTESHKQAQLRTPRLVVLGRNFMKPRPRLGRAPGHQLPKSKRGRQPQIYPLHIHFRFGGGGLVIQSTGDPHTNAWSARTSESVAVDLQWCRCSLQGLALGSVCVRGDGDSTVQNQYACIFEAPYRNNKTRSTTTQTQHNTHIYIYIYVKMLISRSINIKIATPYYGSNYN